MQVEPVAQLFEYASLMSGLTYSDLEVKLKQARGLTGGNPIFKAVSAKSPDIEEASFVDSVNESLRNGDFLHALRNLLANQGGLLARLSLLEIGSPGTRAAVRFSYPMCQYTPNS